MKKLIGLILVLAGVCFGVWAGLWWAFIGGIIDIVNAFKATDISGADVATGLAKVIFASTIGFVAAFLIAAHGLKLLER